MAGLLAGLLTAGVLAAGVLAPAGDALPQGDSAYSPAVAQARNSGEAPTEALARAAATDAGTRVEVASLREERRDVFANPDGSFTAQEYTEPVRARRDGRWVPVDDTLAERADGTYSPKAATVELSFSGGGDGPFARMRRAGREYALTWLDGSLPAPQVNGDTARYAEVLPGVDLAVRAEPEGFSHYLIVKSAEAAASPALDGIELGIATQGLTVRETDGGALQATDSAVGGTVFESSGPLMWDSVGAAPDGGVDTTAEPAAGPAPASGPASAPAAPHRNGAAVKPAADEGTQTGGTALDPAHGGRKAPVALEVSGDRLTLTPDRDLLRGDDTVYPVVIDPAPKTTSRTAWTSVMSGMPSEQDWKYSDAAGMGKCPLDYSPKSCEGIGVRRLLFTFPMSYYSGKQIISTDFSARVAHVYWADARAEPVDLYRIGGKNYKVTSSSDWGNTKDDWDDYLATVDKKISPTSCSSQANLHFSNGELLSEAKAAASGGWTSLSLGLKAKSESSYGGWKRICGNAYLKITYNNPPQQVDYRRMSSNPGGTCTWGSGRPYTDVLPQLRAEARDPDQTSSSTDQVKMQFKVDWTDGGGTARSFTYDTGYKSPTPGTVFSYSLKQRPSGEPQIPQNTVVYWSARAYDGDAWGPWSYDGSAQRCEFIWDSTRPKAPAVSSAEYPADDIWHDGVGTTSTFRFTAADPDVQEFRYGFDGAALSALPAQSGTAEVAWTPQTAGRHWVTVEAYDNADNSSVPAQYEFLVTDGKQAAGQWNLADGAGSDLAHDESGRHPAQAGPAVTFGARGPGGAVDAAAHLDGSADSWLATENAVLDTGGSFTVSAWVRPTALDRDMAVISEDGTGEPGFELGYDASRQAWVFSTPDTDVQAMTRWEAVADGSTVVKDEWTLLTGVFDAYADAGPQLRLYIDGREAGTAIRHTQWSSLSGLQIGRVLARSGYRDPFQGDVAEVRAYDRVLPAAQVAQLGTVKPVRKGYWTLDEAPDHVAANTQSDGPPLNLRGDAAVYRPADPLFDEAALVGDGHVVLDGDGDWADTDAPVIAATDSYTVAARAQLTSVDATASQTVLSLPGEHTDRVVVRYQAATAQWELAVTDTDSTTAQVTTVTDDQVLPSADGSGQHLAVVFDSFTHQVRLYVDGQLTSTAVGMDHTRWPSSAGLQVGRSAQDGGSEYFAGALDEIRVYDGVVDPIGIARMSQLTEDTDL
ncbi:LamG domain-containing protein [Streptomyces sp. A13(2022)]|uniref:LamG domain-containing protein n=1 Tax=Streptomyces sp. A13(2022) TaxID=2964768 RepID=UPI0021DA971F|nr:LamG domain-containing protein [Streptomyces sp. A13(2022)]MCU8589115.1 LamG domain-containing protein [Streptomyces sp. A13(2022)]